MEEQEDAKKKKKLQVANCISATHGGEGICPNRLTLFMASLWQVEMNTPSF